jgi:hypothetical protein
MTIRMERRLLYIPVLHIDTNLINARQKLAAVMALLLPATVSSTHGGGKAGEIGREG